MVSNTQQMSNHLCLAFQRALHRVEDISDKWDDSASVLSDNNMAVLDELWNATVLALTAYNTWYRFAKDRDLFWWDYNECWKWIADAGGWVVRDRIRQAQAEGFGPEWDARHRPQPTAEDLRDHYAGTWGDGDEWDAVWAEYVEEEWMDGLPANAEVL